MLTFLTADVKEKGGDDFLKINDNIQNEKLRAELHALRDEFILMRTRIHDAYSNKMKAVKEARNNEIKALKADFSGLKEDLKKKYRGKMQNKPQKHTTDPVKNTPEKMKVPKDKKKNRKSQ